MLRRLPAMIVLRRRRLVRRRQQAGCQLPDQLSGHIAPAVVAALAAMPATGQELVRQLTELSAVPALAGSLATKQGVDRHTLRTHASART